MKLKCLIAVLFLFVLTACHPALPDQYFTTSILPRVQTSSQLQFDFLVENNYLSTASTTEAYQIEFFDQFDEWRPLATELEFNDEPITIEPYEEQTFLIDLEAYLGTPDIPAGLYRISKVFSVGETSVNARTTLHVK